MEKKVVFEAGNHHLVGLHKPMSPTCGAIITHPHPLYGGDMINPVVESIAQTFNRKGISTLRFNFRGTGNSGGQYDEGVGEQEDILGAVEYLLGCGISTIYLAGYSFGAWVAARVNHLPREVVSLIMVAPPVALLQFDKDRSLPLLQLVLTGEEDEFAPVSLIKNYIPVWNCEAQFEIVDFADHFFFGCFRELERILGEYLRSVVKK